MPSTLYLYENAYTSKKLFYSYNYPASFSFPPNMTKMFSSRPANDNVGNMKPFKGVARKFLRGARRIELALNTDNERIFEIWEV